MWAEPTRADHARPAGAVRPVLRYSAYEGGTACLQAVSSQRQPVRATHRFGCNGALVLLACALALGGCSSISGMLGVQHQPKPAAAQAKPEQAAALEQAVALVTELRYDEAIEKLRFLLPALQASGDTQRTAEAMFWIGFCHERQSRFDQATVWYRRTVNDYPDTPAAEQARQRLPRLESPQ